MLIEDDNVAGPTTSSTVSSPVGIRKNSALYYKKKFEESERLRLSLMEESINVEKIPDFMKY